MVFLYYELILVLAFENIGQIKSVRDTTGKKVKSNEY